MSGARTTRGVILMAALAALSMPASAVFATGGGHHLSGTIGADLGMYNFTNTVEVVPSPFFPQSSQSYFAADRRLSNQFLDLNLNGPVVNNHFANYVARTRIQGTQVRAGTEQEATYEYINPAITSYFGSVSVFTDRRYPVKFYTGSSKMNNVRYEAANRSEVEMIDPGLAVVRRYETVSGSSGVDAKYVASEDLKMDFEVKHTTREASRRYDFDENRNIWADFTSISPGVAPYYNIEVVNTIVGHDVLLYVNFNFIDTIPAGGQLGVVIEEGMTDVDFVPLGLNALSHRLDVQSDMVWKVFYTAPPGALDLDQTNDIVSGRLKYDGDRPFRTEANFEINDGSESVQLRDTNLKVFNNVAGYDLSENSTLAMQSNLSSTTTDTREDSHQLSRTFMNQTTGKWARDRGLRTSLTHSYFNQRSETRTDSLLSIVTSNNNIVNGVVNYPTNWQRHEVNLRVGANILSDSNFKKDSKYSSEVRNQLEWRNYGFRWNPRHSLKYSRGKTELTDPGITQSQRDLATTTNNQWENRLMLTGENPQLGPLGTLKLRGEHGWRRRSNPGGTDTNRKYLGEVNLTKKFNEGYRVKVGSAWEKETFSADLVGDQGPLIELPRRRDEVRKTVRIDLQTRPLSWIDLGYNAMKITTNESRITKYSASLALRVPGLNIPLKSFLSKERRELAGTRPQELFRVETRSSYNFRKIRLVLAHEYTHERLQTEDYTFGEFSVKVYRDFDIY